ncbi:MAG: LamG domain-containing protein [bacterium]
MHPQRDIPPIHKIFWAILAVLLLAVIAQAIDTNEIEIGANSVYDDTVKIGRSVSGQLLFKDVDHPSSISLSDLSEQAASHGSMTGLSADDHPQYLNESRHSTVHSATWNGNMSTPPDAAGNTVLADHLQDLDIHPNRTGVSEITGNWRFAGTPRIWNGLDFSAAGSDGDVQFQFSDSPDNASILWSDAKNEFESNRNWRLPNLVLDSSGYIGLGTSSARIAFTDSPDRADCYGYFAFQNETDFIAEPTFRQNLNTYGGIDYLETDGLFNLTGANLLVGTSRYTGASSVASWLYDSVNGDVTSSADIGINTTSPAADFVVNGKALIGGNTSHDLLDSALVMHYKMNDNAANSTVTNNAGSPDGDFMSGGVSDNTENHDVTGQINGALDFDGTDDYVDTSILAGNVLNTDFTIAFWVKFDDGQPAANTHIVGTMNDPNDRFQIMIMSTGSIFCEYKVDDEFYTVQTDAGSIADGATGWHHFAAVYDSQNNIKKAYLDGNEAVSSSYSGNPANFGLNANIYLGHHYLSSCFAGQMDDVRFYSEALSTAEISTIYSGGAGTEETSFAYELDVDGNLYVDGAVHAASLLVLSDPRDKIFPESADVAGDEATSKVLSASAAVTRFWLKSDLYEEKSTTRTVSLDIPYTDTKSSQTLTRQVTHVIDTITTVPKSTIPDARLGFRTDRLPEEAVKHGADGKDRVDPMALLAIQMKAFEQLRNDLKAAKTEIVLLQSQMAALEARIAKIESSKTASEIASP